MKTVEIGVYQFNELSESAKKKQGNGIAQEPVRTRFGLNALLKTWRRIGKILGIDIDNIYFFRFQFTRRWSLFEGYYSYQKEVQKGPAICTTRQRNCI